MAPKENSSKKAQKKKQDKAIEDRTFGLKNKNKSKKVQEFITGVEKTVKNSNKGGDKVCMDIFPKKQISKYFSVGKSD